MQTKRVAVLVIEIVETVVIITVLLASLIVFDIGGSVRCYSSYCWLCISSSILINLNLVKSLSNNIWLVELAVSETVITFVNHSDQVHKGTQNTNRFLCLAFSNRVVKPSTFGISNGIPPTSSYFARSVALFWLRLPSWKWCKLSN